MWWLARAKSAFVGMCRISQIAALSHPRFTQEPGECLGYSQVGAKEAGCKPEDDLWHIPGTSEAMTKEKPRWTQEQINQMVKAYRQTRQALMEV